MVGRSTSYTLLCPSPASTCDWPESASTTAMQNCRAKLKGRTTLWPGQMWPMTWTSHCRPHTLVLLQSQGIYPKIEYAPSGTHVPTPTHSGYPEPQISLPK